MSVEVRRVGLGDDAAALATYAAVGGWRVEPAVIFEWDLAER